MSIFHPSGGYPRLFRYVSAAEMPTPHTLTTHDDQFNVIVINKEIYDSLDWFGKYRAERATTTLMIDSY